MNPLLELAMRPRPIEDAWGYTVRQAMAVHVGAHEDCWVLGRPEGSLLVLRPPRDTCSCPGRPGHAHREGLVDAGDLSEADEIRRAPRDGSPGTRTAWELRGRGGPHRR